jgi:hypothetical protein
MHVINTRFAPVWNIFLDEVVVSWVEYLKFIISRSLIVAERACDRKVLRSSIKNNFCWLAFRRSNVNSSNIDGIILILERDF